ncbi:MAG: GNAT family N-acetyltransferase [Candidatus Heimdallarchaeaceae archaeon]
MIFKIRLKESDEDEMFFDELQFESFKETLKDAETLTEEEIRKKYSDFDSNDPLDLNDSNHMVFIAEDEEKERAGLIWICKRDPFWRFKNSLMWIYNLHTVPKFRGKGLAIELMRKAEEKAQELNLEIISLHVIDSNTPARRLYEKLGYELAVTYNESCFYDKRIEITE